MAQSGDPPKSWGSGAFCRRSKKKKKAPGRCLCWGGKRIQDVHRYTVVMVGLDGAGKTTFTHTVQGVFDDPDTTVGFIPSEIERNGTALKMWDLGGGKRIRGIWGDYVGEVHAAVWVLDAADTERLEENKTELHAFIKHNEFYGKPLLILLNKADKPGSKSVDELERLLDLPKLRTRCEYKATACVCKPSSFNGQVDGRIWAGVDWLCSQVSSEYDELNRRIQKHKDTPKPPKPKPPPVEKEVAKKREEPPPDEVPMCTCCMKEPAVTRCSQSKWEAVCESCVTILRKPADQGGMDVRELKRLHQGGGGEPDPPAQLAAGLPGAMPNTPEKQGLAKTIGGQSSAERPPQPNLSKTMGGEPTASADEAAPPQRSSSEGQGLKQS